MMTRESELIDKEYIVLLQQVFYMFEIISK